MCVRQPLRAGTARRIKRPTRPGIGHHILSVKVDDAAGTSFVPKRIRPGPRGCSREHHLTLQLVSLRQQGLDPSVQKGPCMHQCMATRGHACAMEHILVVASSLDRGSIGIGYAVVGSHQPTTTSCGKAKAPLRGCAVRNKGSLRGRRHHRPGVEKVAG
jgi:hypothetical protein